jgi:hypothetical protein
MSKPHKQFLTTDVNVACLLAFMGYSYKLLSDPLGVTFAFVDPGDLMQAVHDFHAHIQVADAKKLLEVRSRLDEDIKPNRRTP